MEITVDRSVSSEGNLVFTITAKNPHKSPFGELEVNVLSKLDSCREMFSEDDELQSKLIQDVVALIYTAKEKAFTRVKRNLTFAIDEQLNPMIDPIRQEIYNWIYDMQDKPIKTWMSEFDPQRTKYYFCNDDKHKAYYQNSSTMPDDKFDDEEGDDEMDE